MALFLTVGAASAFAEFNGSGTTAVSLTIGPEASIQVDTATTNLAPSGGTFSDFVGTTNYTYKIRTSQSGGSGSITLKITSDFGNSGGPSVANPVSASDALQYSCTAVAPATGCSSEQTASTTSDTAVASFGADQRSAKAGTSGNSVNWKLNNNPEYKTGTSTATATFTISAA